MNKKKHIHLHGTVLLPIVIGGCAVIFSGGNIIRTSRVVSVREQTSERVCFETLNSNYWIVMDPFPLAGAVQIPICAAA